VPFMTRELMLNSPQLTRDGGSSIFKSSPFSMSFHMAQRREILSAKVRHIVWASDVACGTAASRRVNSAFELLKVRNSRTDCIRSS
jgi:hypothetical protein